MVKHGWILLILGGMLSIPFGIQAGTIPSALLVGISVVTAVGPLLILVGYDALADRSGGGGARSGLQVAGLGLLILAGSDIASIVMPLMPDGRGGEHVLTAYKLALALIALGSIGAGIVLFKGWFRIALPLLIGAGAVAVVLVRDAHTTPVYTLWCLTCVWLGVALKWSR